MRPIEGPKRLVNHIAPSEQASMASGWDRPGRVKIRRRPRGVSRPIELLGSVNQSAPSGPTAIPRGSWIRLWPATPTVADWVTRLVGGVGGVRGLIAEE